MKAVDAIAGKGQHHRKVPPPFIGWSNLDVGPNLGTSVLRDVKSGVAETTAREVVWAIHLGSGGGKQQSVVERGRYRAVVTTMRCDRGQSEAWSSSYDVLGSPTSGQLESSFGTGCDRDPFDRVSFGSLHGRQVVRYRHDSLVGSRRP